MLIKVLKFTKFKNYDYKEDKEEIEWIYTINKEDDSWTAK